MQADKPRKWTNKAAFLYKTSMHSTVFMESLHYVPAAGWTRSAFTVLRAGKVAAAPDYVVRRDRHAGQDILYCLSGGGVVETEGRRLKVEPGQLAWIANEAPHAHMADPRSPWTLLWFRLDGPNPSALREKLFGEAASRVSIIEGALLVAWFEQLFAAMRGRELGLDSRVNQLVGEFLLVTSTGPSSSQRRPGCRRRLRPLSRLCAWTLPGLGTPVSSQPSPGLAHRKRDDCFASTCAPVPGNGCCASA
jgi:AraC-like protein